MFSKLAGFIDSAPWPPSAGQTAAQTKGALESTVLPYLKGRFPKTPSTNLPSATPALLEVWCRVTETLASVLPIESLFPVVDMWRLSLLDPVVATWIAGSPPHNPVTLFVPKAIEALQAPSKASRNYILTVLRMLANGFANPASARWLALGPARDNVTQVVIPSLLHEDATVRTSAASLAFNMAVVIQKPRVEALRSGRRWTMEIEGEAVGEWEVEMVSAVTEAIEREKENEEVRESLHSLRPVTPVSERSFAVHRLTACLGFLVRLSPWWKTSVKPLLEVLQTRDILKAKLINGSGWNADHGIAKKEIRRLVEEVADRLCSA